MKLLDNFNKSSFVEKLDSQHAQHAQQDGDSRYKLSSRPPGFNHSRFVAPLHQTVCLFAASLVLLSNVKVSLAIALSIKIPPSNAQARLNSPCQLQCEFNFPPTYINWDFSRGNDVFYSLFICHLPTDKCTNLLDQFVNYTEYQVENSGQNLLISDLRTRNNGRYRCTGLYGIEAVTAAANITVLVEPAVPLITTNISNPTDAFFEGQSVRFQCTSLGGNPAPQFTWILKQKDTNISKIIPLTQWSPASVIFGNSSGDIELKFEAKDDGAELTCQAINELNRVNSAIMKLNVLHKPRIDEFSTNSVKILENEEHNAVCQSQGNPTPQVYWRKADIQLTSPTFGANYLYFKNVRRSEEGMYECIASNKLGETVAELKFEVYYAPIVTTLFSLKVQQSKQLLVNCDVVSNPPPHIIQWRQVSSEQLWSNQSQLIVTQATRELAGQFRCEAINRMMPNSGLSAGQTVTKTGMRYTTIEVEYLPGVPTVIATSLGGTNVLVGQRVALLCQENLTSPGFPSPNFFWTHIDSDGSIVVGNGPELIFSVVNLNHNGMYRCTPQNELGQGEYREVILNVNEAPTYFTKLPAEQTRKLINNDNFMLTCSAHGRPAPQIIWLKDGLPLLSNREYFHIVSTSVALGLYDVKVNSTLQFNGIKRIPDSIQLMPEDNGNYQCKAVNEIGTIESKGILNVLYKPVLISGAKNKQAVDIGDGISADLRCSFSALPRPIMTWSFRGKVLEANEKYTIRLQSIDDKNIVSILSLKGIVAADFGEYVCNCSNSEGYSLNYLELQQITIPEPPTSLKVIDTTWESAHLDWIPGFNGGLPQNFSLHLAWIDPTDSLTTKASLIQLLSDHGPTYNVTGLYPTTNYTFRIVGNNKRGQGQFSQSMHFTTESLFFPALKIISIAQSTLSYLGLIGYCVRIEESRDTDSNYKHPRWFSYKACLPSEGGTVQIDGSAMYRASICLVQRNDICSKPIEIQPLAASDISIRDIIIAGCVCGSVIFVLLIVLTYFCCRRRRPNKDYEADPAHRRLQPVTDQSRASLDDGVNQQAQTSLGNAVLGPNYHPVGTTSSAASTDSQVGSALGCNYTQHILLKPASVGLKPYALVSPHHTQQEMHFDNMALSPSDPQGKLFATTQSARDPLISNNSHNNNNNIACLDKQKSDTKGVSTPSPTGGPPSYLESVVRACAVRASTLAAPNSVASEAILVGSSPSQRIEMRPLPAASVVNLRDSNESYRHDMNDYSRESYSSNLTASGLKPKKVVYEVVV